MKKIVSMALLGLATWGAQAQTTDSLSLQEVGEEVLCLWWQFALSITEYPFRLLCRHRLAAYGDVFLTQSIPVIVKLLVAERVVEAVASIILPAVPSLGLGPSIADVQSVNPLPDNLADAV